MVELAIAGNAGFKASRIEVDRAGPSYTVDTLEALRGASTSDDRLALILSAESFAELPTWHEPERILELASIDRGAARRIPRRGCGIRRAQRVPGRRRGGLPRRPADPPVGIGDPRTRRRRAFRPLSRPGCGRGIYRRPCPLPRLTEDRSIVTDPALPNAVAPSADGLPRRATPAPTTDERAALDLARRIVELAEDKKAADIVAARARAADDPRGLLRDLLGWVGTPARCDRGRHRLGAARREGATDRARGDGRVALGAYSISGR